MRLQSLQLASAAQITSIGPFMVTTPSTTVVEEKTLRTAKKTPVLGGVRAILLSAFVGSGAWYLIWEAGKYLLHRH
jgi:hypothetical protein